MEFSAASFAVVLALVGVVIIVASLLSGLIERTNFPQVAVFLVLGAILGPPGLGLLDVTLDSPILRVVATLSLTLVLFTDAVGLSIPEARRHARLAFLVLGPGTMLSAVLVTLAGAWFLGLPLAAAAIVGAALASTDPVLLRGLLRSRDLPAAARQALRLESGLNDVVLLPIVLVAMAFLGHSNGGGEVDWTRMLVDLFLLGPGSGVLVGLLAVATLDLVRRRIGVRRDYESIYSLGVAFAAFAVAESVHGSGFLAAFAAGLTISALDVELCDCFLEYGETTAEMALLFTFVLFGSSLIWSGLGVLTLASLAFALTVILIRPVVFLISLLGTKLPRRDRLLISWFGPRGLSTLLLVLLPVFDGVEGGQAMFAICCLVVLVSIVLHGGSMMMLGRWSRGAKSEPPPPDESPDDSPPIDRVEPVNAPITFMPAPPPAVHRAPVPAEPSHNGHIETALTPPLSDDAEHTSERMTIAEMRRLQEQGKQVFLVDARTERALDYSEYRVVGSLRLEPGAGRLAERAADMGLPKDAWLAIFCA